MMLALLAFFVASVVCFIVAIYTGAIAPERSRYEEYQELYGGYQRFPGYEEQPVWCVERSPDDVEVPVGRPWRPSDYSERPPDYWDRMDEAREIVLKNAVPIGRNKNLTRTSAINLTTKERTCEQQRNPFLRPKGSRGGGSATL